MARRGNGEGSITKVRDNLWMGRVMIGYKKDGKPNRKTVYGKTRKEVQDKLVKLLNEVNMGTYIEPTKITLAQWLQEWLDKYKKVKIKPSTYELYESLIKIIINPELGNIPLKDLRPIQIQSFYNKLYEEEKYSSSTVRKIHVVLRGALDQAVKNRLILENVTLHVELPRPDTKKVKVFTLEEQRKFEECAKNYKYYAAYIVMLDTGLREGELLALEWDDIDFTNKYVSVNKTLIWVKDKNTGKYTQIVQYSTKTKSSHRKVPLTQRSLKLLKELKLKQASKSKIIFCTSSGTHILKRNFLRTFHTILKRIGIPKCGVHSLRHTFATRLFENNVPPKTISKLLGHSSVSTTLNIYTHVLPSVEQDAIKVLDILHQQIK